MSLALLTIFDSKIACLTFSCAELSVSVTLATGHRHHPTFGEKICGVDFAGLRTKTMIQHDANETDVREEIAAPMLAALGYERGTANNIGREATLAYERQFLGKKKGTDHPLRGRADYILTVAGAGRWVLEIKAPKEPIDIDAIEQTISYARHPEVSASYAVVLNGQRLTVHYASQKSTDNPIVDLVVSDPLALASQLEGLLSPAAIRRDCSPPC